MWQDGVPRASQVEPRRPSRLSRFKTSSPVSRLPVSHMHTHTVTSRPVGRHRTVTCRHVQYKRVRVMSRVGGRQVAQQQCRWQQPAGWQHAKARELPTSDNTPAPSAIALRSPASERCSDLKRYSPDNSLNSGCSRARELKRRPASAKGLPKVAKDCNLRWLNYTPHPT